MKLLLSLRQLWSWLPPDTWAETYAVIFSLLFIFLATTWLLDCLKGALP